jgi:hypothetical protein
MSSGLSPSGQTSKTVQETQPLSAIDQQKLALERDKLELERAKLAAEIRDKERSLYVSWIQVLIAVLAIGTPIWLAYIQSRTETKRRREDEVLQFQLKAAEIALDTTESSLAVGKAAALKALFPDRLPDGFASSLDQKNISFGPGREMRLQFLKILAEHPDNREFLADVWGIMWPGDGSIPDWRKELWSKYKWWVELKKYLEQHKTGPTKME